MTCRCTLRLPTLPTNAKGIPPDEAKTMSRGAIDEQTRKNEKFNKIANELTPLIQSRLSGADITWCEDGCIVLSAWDTLANVEKMINDLGFEITVDRPEIKHKVKATKFVGMLDTFDSKGIPIQIRQYEGEEEEDIDEVLEPFTVGETKKLKSRAVTNQYQIKKVLEA